MKPGTILYDNFDKLYKRTNNLFSSRIECAPDLRPVTVWWLDVRVGSKWADQAEMMSPSVVEELRVVGRLEALVVLGEKI